MLIYHYKVRNNAHKNPINTCTSNPLIPLTKLKVGFGNIRNSHLIPFLEGELSTSLFLLRFVFSLVVTCQLLIVQLGYYIIWCTYVIGQHSTMQSLCVAIQTKLLCNPFSNLTSRMNTTGFALLFNCLLYAYPCILTTIKVNSTLKTCFC